MSAFASERRKLASTRTTAALAAGLAGVVTLAALVHVAGFDAVAVDDAAEQRAILTDIGVSMGLVFAAIAGSLAITTEFRHGTIRPTVLKHPARTGVLDAKLAVNLGLGALLAASATALAVGFAAALLEGRGLSLALDRGEVAQLVLGAAVGGAGFGALGLAIGTIVRNQVAVVVGLLLWLLFIENLLRAGLPSIARYSPGSLARALSAAGPGQFTSAPLAAAGLTLIVAAGFAAARLIFARRDIA